MSGLNLDVRVKMRVKLPQKSVVGSGLILKGMGKLVLKASGDHVSNAVMSYLMKPSQWVICPTRSSTLLPSPPLPPCVASKCLAGPFSFFILNYVQFDYRRHNGVYYANASLPFIS